MADAPVNKIIPFSMVDGPGSRTAVFLQGCNLRCLYCHNPETQSLCTSCGECVPVCPAEALSAKSGIVQWEAKKCISCDACIKACQNSSSPRVRWMKAQEVFARIENDIIFIRGITVSGGECTLYPDFIQELFTLAKSRGLTTLIDTNGMSRLSAFSEMMAVCDGVMLDVKSWDSDMFRALTGSTNDTVKENLAYLAAENKLEEIRIVCLDGHVDAAAAINGIARLLGNSTAEQKLKLIKFRKYGVRGIPKDMPPPSDAMMESLRKKAAAAGFINIRII